MSENNQNPDNQNQSNNNPEGGGQESSESWYSGASEEHHDLLSKYADIDDLAGEVKSFKSNDVDINSIENFEEFTKIAQSRLKVPKEYKVDSDKFNKEFVSQFAEVSKKAGLHPRQASAMLDSLSKLQEQELNKQNAESRESRVSEIKKLMEEDSSFEDKVQKGILKVAGNPEELKKKWGEDALSNPQVLKMLADIGDKVEDSLVEGPDSGLNPDIHSKIAELKAKRDELLRSSSSPYYNPEHPEHHAAVRLCEEYEELASSVPDPVKPNVIKLTNF